MARATLKTTGSGLPPATETGQLLYSADGVTFIPAVPLVNGNGSIQINGNGKIVVRTG